MLREGRPVELPLTGASMRPLFAPGDVVRVWPARVEDVRLGDVVLVEFAGQLLAHRLIAVGERVIVTRGDAMPSADRPLPRASLHGRVEVAPSPRALYAAVRALLRC